jgi:hypothetical protein
MHNTVLARASTQHAARVALNNTSPLYDKGHLVFYTIQGHLFLVFLTPKNFTSHKNRRKKGHEHGLLRWPVKVGVEQED